MARRNGKQRSKLISPKRKKFKPRNILYPRNRLSSLVSRLSSLLASIIKLSPFPSALIIFIFLFVISPNQLWAYSRIISLKPNITEILFALGVGKKIVGATNFCNRPNEAIQIPRVADYIRVDPEKVLRLKPDLIIGSKENSSQKEIYFLEDRGLTVKLLSFGTIPETMQSIEEIGKLVGKETEAKEITKKMKNNLNKLRRNVQGAKWKKALFVVGYQPLVVAGGHNFFDEAMPYIGAFNVARLSKLRYPTYSTEQLIRSKPEIIFDMSMGSEKSTQAPEKRLKWWRQFRSIPAVKWNQVYIMDIEKMRPGPSLPLTFQELYKIIHRGPQGQKK